MSEHVKQAERALAAARQGVLMMAAPQVAVLEVTGGDRVSWINGLVTCDVAKVHEGDGLYGLAVTQKGRILADVVLLLSATRLLVAAPRAHVAELRASFEKYLVMEDAEVTPGHDAFEALWLLGPAAGELLEAVRKDGVDGALVRREGAAPGGVVGALVLIPLGKARPHLEVAAKAVEASGRPVARASREAWDIVRVELGLPAFGVDFGPTTYPQEVGLEKSAVSFSKGCYLGQEVICMLEMRGQVKRRLVQLALDGAQPAVGAEVQDGEGNLLGNVTSSSVRAQGEGALALALVKRAQASRGADLRVDGRPARVLAVVGHDEL